MNAENPGPPTMALRQIAKRFALIASWVVIAAIALNQTVELSMAKGDIAHMSARLRMYFDLAKRACISREQFEATVANQGWRSERLQTPFNDSLLNDSLPTALLVYVDPPLPFGIVDWVVYQFDPSGCLAGT